MTTDPTDSSVTPWWWALIAVMVIFAGMIWFACIVQYVLSHDALSQCLSSTPPGVVVSEDSSHYSYNITLFPVGRECTYDLADGGTVTTQTGWFTTVIALLGSVAVVAISVFWMRFIKSLSIAHRVAAFVVLVGAALGWVNLVWVAQAY